MNKRYNDAPISILGSNRGVHELVKPVNNKVKSIMELSFK